MIKWFLNLVICFFFLCDILVRILLFRGLFIVIGLLFEDDLFLLLSFILDICGIKFLDGFNFLFFLFIFNDWWFFIIFFECVFLDFFLVGIIFFFIDNFILFWRCLIVFWFFFLFFEIIIFIVFCIFRILWLLYCLDFWCIVL